MSGFLVGCVYYKKQSPTAGALVNSAGIVVFKVAYENVAVKLTDAENWMTDTVYADKLISRLSVFNFVNSYFRYFLRSSSTAGLLAMRGKETRARAAWAPTASSSRTWASCWRRRSSRKHH